MISRNFSKPRILEPLMNNLSAGHEFMYWSWIRDNRTARTQQATFVLQLNFASQRPSGCFPVPIMPKSDIVWVWERLNDRLCITSHHQCHRMNHIFVGSLHWWYRSRISIGSDVGVRRAQGPLHWFADHFVGLWRRWLKLWILSYHSVSW